MSTLKGIPSKRITSFLDSERNWNWLASHSLEVDGDTITIGSDVVTSDNIVDRTIQALDIQTATITATEIGANTIRADNILADTLTANEIAADAITTSELAANSVTSAKIVANTITASDIQAATITTTEIAANTITASDIAAGTITSTEIASATITGSNVAAATITGSNVAAATINTTNLVSTAIDAMLITGASYRTSTSNPRVVLNSSGLYGYNTGGSTVFSLDTGTGNLILSGEVTANSSSVIPAVTVTGQLTDAQIAALAATKLTGQITTTQITDDAVTTAKIAANTIIAGDIAANTLTANEIAANAIDTSELNANAVTSAKIAANTIVAADITAGTITTTEIAATTIVAGNIAASTITGSQIAATTITASNIAASTITGAKIAATTIDTANLVATAIDAMIITGATFKTSSGSSRVQMDSTGVFYTSDGGTTKDIHLTTSGLQLLSGTTSSPPNERRIRWFASGTLNGEILTYDDTTNSYWKAAIARSNRDTHIYLDSQYTGASSSGCTIDLTAASGVAGGTLTSTRSSANAKVGTIVNNTTDAHVDNYAYVQAGGVVKKIFKGDGTSDYAFDTGWTTWSPTWTGITVGNGTTTAQYCQIGKVVHYKISFLVGSTTTMTSIPNFTLPVTSATNIGTLGASPVGQVRFLDTGTVQFAGDVDPQSTTVCRVLVFQANANFVQLSGTNTTTPHTWANTDELNITGWYRAA